MTAVPVAAGAAAAGAAVDAVVVGSGVAGLSAALELAAHGRVLLVTKTSLGEGSTAWAQGGIAVVTSEDDDVPAHVEDTLAAGAGACDLAAVRLLCAEGPARVRELAARGVAFDRVGGPGTPWARGLEAAHRRARVLHAGGDVTGARTSAALVDRVRESSVQVAEHTALVDLLVEGGRVVGVEVLSPTGLERVRAGAVLLATGGAGQLFSRTTNPTVATGDGLAAAWRAGAAVADLEYVQFHPTAAAVGAAAAGGAGFLVSEAVRGEGAVLLDVDGRRFMTEVDPRAELAPRDVVARAIGAVMARQDGRPVLLDATHLGERLRTRFPGIDALCRDAGLDWTREPVPVTPAAHYAMGGVATDLAGRTSLPGLWAVGEVARTGVHGANRLASNSLLEGLVFAARAAADVVVGGGPALEASGDVVVLPAAADGPAALGREELQALTWEHAGLHRDAAGLELAAKALAPVAPPRRAGTVREVEDASLATGARLLLAAAARREESRGAHFRGDFPALYQEPYRSTTLVRGAR